MKTCKTCGEKKPLAAFHEDPRRPDGHRSSCKECRSKARRQWYERNRAAVLKKARERYVEQRETIRAKQREYYEANKKQIGEYQADYRASRKEEMKAYFHDYYEKHAEEIKARKREYRKANPEKVRAWNRKRKQLTRAAPRCDLTITQWRAIKEAYGHRCAYCGKHLKHLTKDHVVPISKGGSHTADNIVPACMSCNNKKKAGEAPAMVVTPRFPQED